MNNFFKFFEDNYPGIIIFLLSTFVVILFLDWIAKIFSIGKYRNLPKDGSSSSLVYVFSQLLVKIITDFRHFLALVLVLIFAIALGVAFSFANHTPAEGENRIDNLVKALQAVVATLGGLVGSIVGYYFGESAGRRNNSANQGQAIEDPSPPIQGAGAQESETIVPARGPNPGGNTAGGGGNG
jgi:hypothetical protein